MKSILNYFNLIICAILAIIWMILPKFTMGLFGLEINDSAHFIAIRNGALFVGIAFALAYDIWKNNFTPALHIGITIASIILSLSGAIYFYNKAIGGLSLLIIIGEIIMCMFNIFVLLREKSNYNPAK